MNQPLNCCETCQLFFPLDKVRPRSNRNLCKVHLVEALKHQRSGTLEKRAAMSVWSRCLKDLSTFRQPSVRVTLKQIQARLDSRVHDYTKLCLMPLSPLVPVTIGNVALVSRDSRKLLVSASTHVAGEALLTRMLLTGSKMTEPRSTENISLRAKRLAQWVITQNSTTTVVIDYLLLKVIRRLR